MASEIYYNLSQNYRPANLFVGVLFQILEIFLYVFDLKQVAAAILNQIRMLRWVCENKTLTFASS